jgi:hypothetical protein
MRRKRFVGGQLDSLSLWRNDERTETRRPRSTVTPHRPSPPTSSEPWVKSRVYPSEAVYNPLSIAGITEAIIMDIVTTLRQQLSITRSTGPAPYACQACCTRFDAQRQVCPACGSYTIERTEWPCLE